MVEHTIAQFNEVFKERALAMSRSRRKFFCHRIKWCWSLHWDLICVEEAENSKGHPDWVWEANEICCEMGFGETFRFNRFIRNHKTPLPKDAFTYFFGRLMLYAAARMNLVGPHKLVGEDCLMINECVS